MNQVNLNQSVKKKRKPFNTNGFSTYQAIYDSEGNVLKAHGRSNKRFKLINWDDFKGRTVLDLGCSNGMLGIEAARHGASRVVGVERGNSIATSREYVKYEGLDDRIDFYQIEIENKSFLRNAPRFDIVFYTAMMSWTKDAHPFCRWIDDHCRRIAYFETNCRHDVEKQLNDFKMETTFHDYRFLGDTSEDATGPGVYSFFRCARQVRETNDVYDAAPLIFIPIEQIRGDALRHEKEWHGTQHLENLKEKISRLGLKYPIAVIEKDGMYKGIEGGRRMIALKELGWTQIPCKLISNLGEFRQSMHDEKNLNLR